MSQALLKSFSKSSRKSSFHFLAVFASGAVHVYGFNDHDCLADYTVSFPDSFIKCVNPKNRIFFFKLTVSEVRNHFIQTFVYLTYFTGTDAFYSKSLGQMLNLSCGNSIFQRADRFLPEISLVNFRNSEYSCSWSLIAPYLVFVVKNILAFSMTFFN